MKTMKIAVLGTGMVGETIGSKLVELGHHVMMGSRSATNEKALAFVKKNGSKASSGTFADAAAFGAILINCTAGSASLDVLRSADNDDIKNKILIDIANPLDFSQGMPPSLSVCNTSSLAEQIQKEFPDLKVVKALNTMWCGLMVNPGMINGGDHTTFISGNDKGAKDAVKEILMSFGWDKKNILDLGDIVTARGTEMYLPLWLNVYSSTNIGAFNIKVVS